MLGLVKSQKICGLGPILATNHDLGTIHFIRDVAVRSKLTKVEFRENGEMPKGVGCLAVESGTTAPQESYSKTIY